MQAATAAAPTRRSRASLKAEPSTDEAEPDEAQQPALVSRLQARFDALALADAQQQSESLQSAAPSHGADGPSYSALQHEPTLMVLDGQLQAMPWESLPTFRRLRSDSRLCVAKLPVITSM